jgi:hypothetical protein
MSSRFWTWVKNLADGQTARTDPINSQLGEIQAAFDKVAAELNQGFRFPSGVPNEGAFKFDVTAAQRANQLLGFDANGVPQLRSGTFTWRGDWTSNALYRVNDVVRAPAAAYWNSIYVVTTQHQSGVFADNLAAGFHSLMIDLEPLNRFIRKFQLVNANYEAQAGDDLMVDVSAGAISITLPANPSITDQPISITHVAGNIVTNNIAIVRNGKLIQGIAEDMIVSTMGPSGQPTASFELAFCNDATGWRLVKGT